MRKKPLYAALDLHSEHSVLGSMDHDGNNQPRVRFATGAESLRAQLNALRAASKRPVHLTMEAGPLSRWASAIARPLVDQLIICEPRHNRLINANPTKNDGADVEGMCLLQRLGKLKEVWMGVDRTREIYRALVYELLNWRDAQRELKALIKARYRQWGVLRLNGLKVFSKILRQDYLDQLPTEERRMMQRIYAQHDHAIAHWRETLAEVKRIGGEFWEVRAFERIPGVGPMAAHVFSAIIETPERFATKHKLWKYSQLGITDRTSDNKPLGYQRLDRRGNRELKNLSYHAWRTACKSTTGPNVIKAFYQQSRLRTGSVRHARLNTQRKILETMWLMWLRRRPFAPEKFARTENAPGKARRGETRMRPLGKWRFCKTKTYRDDSRPSDWHQRGKSCKSVWREWQRPVAI